MKGQKGFTLIEILASVAILSIVLLAIGTAMVTGTRSFAKGNAEASVQKEAQLAVNQVEDLIIDTNGSVDLLLYAGGTQIDLDSVTTREEMAEKDALADKKELVLYNAVTTDLGTVYTKEMVTWEKDTEKVSYSFWNVNYDSAHDTYEVVEPAVHSMELLAENVVSFSVDLSDTKKEELQDGTEIDVLRSVQIAAGYCSGNNMVSYATTPLIALRNRLVKGGDPGLGLIPPVDETQPFKLYISGASETVYLAVPIIDRVTEVECEKMYNVYAMLNGGGNISDSVIFSIEEECQSTISSSGVLSVGELESNEYLTIVATHRDDPTRVAKGVVKVVAKSNKKLIAAHIFPDKLPAFHPQYLSLVETENFEEEDSNALQYTWTVSNPEYFSTISSVNGDSSRLKLDVNQSNEEVYGKTVQIYLEVYAPTIRQKVSATIAYTIDEKGSEGDALIVRGQHDDGNVFSFETTYDPSKRTYIEYYVCDEAGNKVEDDKIYHDCFSVKDGEWSFGGRTSYQLYISQELPWNKNFNVHVIIRLVDTGEQVYDKIIPVSAVKMFPCDTAANGNGAFYFYLTASIHDQILASSWQDNFGVVIEEIVTKDGINDVSVELVNNLNTAELAPSKGLYKAQGQYKVVGNTDNVLSIKFKIYVKKYPDEIYTYTNIVF